MGHTPSSPPKLPPNPLPYHRSLHALTQTIALLTRAHLPLEAAAWKDWTEIVFDASDCQVAFSQELNLPETSSRDEDVALAEDWLKIAGKELSRRKIQDTHELFIAELKEYFERKRRRLREEDPKMIKAVVGRGVSMLQSLMLYEQEHGEKDEPGYGRRIVSRFLRR